MATHQGDRFQSKAKHIFLADGAVFVLHRAASQSVELLSVEIFQHRPKGIRSTYIYLQD